MDIILRFLMTGDTDSGRMKKSFGKIVFCVLISISVFLSISVFAKGIDFDITVDKTRVSLGESIRLSLTFHNTTSISAPDIGKIDGFSVRYLGPSTMMSIVNGKVSTSITHNYLLLPLKSGVFKIGPFSIEHKGKTYTSNSIEVEVVSGATHAESGGQTGGSSGMQNNLEDRIFLVMEVPRRKVYLNEIVPITVKLYVNQLAVRDIQYPEIPHDGFSLRQFGKPRQYREVINGLNYDVIEFKTYAFATRTGSLTVGPAKLKCNLIIKKKDRRVSSPFDDFFGRDIFDDFFAHYETYPLELKSAQINMDVEKLPQEGRPQDAKNVAVGDFNFTLEVSPKEVKVGDPVTLKMTIEGEGNFDTVGVPQLSSKDGFKVYEPAVKQEDGKKIFEQVVIPQNTDIKEIPEITFVFFNPHDGKYHTLTQGPVPITVKGTTSVPSSLYFPKKEKEGEKQLQEKLGKDIIYIKTSPGKVHLRDHYLYREWWFRLLTGGIFILFIGFVFFQQHKERLRTDENYARKLRAPRKAREGLHRASQFLKSTDREKFYEVISKTIREYLGDKFHLPPAGITQDIIDDVLKPKGVREDILDKLRFIFSESDLARYAPAELDRSRMEVTLQRLKEVIDYFERTKI